MRERNSDGRVLLYYRWWSREGLIDMSFNSGPERSDRMNGVCMLVKSALGMEYTKASRQRDANVAKTR